MAASTPDQKAPSPSVDEPEHIAIVRLLSAYATMMTVESQIRIMKADENDRHASIFEAWRQSLDRG